MQLIRFSVFILLIFSSVQTFAADTIKVDINLDIKRSVKGISKFDREKYIVLHSTLNERDWANETEKFNYVFGDLDVYLGRDNGGINWWLGQMKEDAARPGFADSTDIKSRGASSRSQWGHDSRNVYDSKSDVMIGGQVQAIWPGKKSGWDLHGADAAGEYMAHYVNEFYRNMNDSDVNHGMPAPRFLEVLNEPLYGLHDDNKIPANEKIDPIEIFRFHRDVAKAFKKYNTTTKIGGYTVAFPEYDVDDFKRWEDRMKLFVDTAGTDMDFYSLHLYDFNRHWKTDYKNHIHFKGSRTEATLDMLEQYDMLKSGEVKPMVISEFGGRDLLLEQKTWSKERDWMTLKAMSAFTIQFMQRPDNIVKTVPFIMNKAPWSLTPHAWRLMIQEHEPESYVANDWTSPYVFSELIKYYELWSDVRGTRVDSWSGNPDILSDVYIDGNKAYLILSNLNFDEQTIRINLFGHSGNPVQNIRIKHLYAVNDIPELEETTPTKSDDFILGSEATAVIEYTFQNALSINQSETEKKYYSETYLQKIEAGQEINFSINGVESNSLSIGELRVSFGRAHSASKKPLVTFNGSRLNVPENISGATQKYRPEGFFGMLQIPVPGDLIKANNSVTVQFPDAGGHVSSVTMRVFNYSRKVSRSDSVQSISLYPNSVEMGIGQERILTPTIKPANASDPRITWSSSNPNIVIVNNEGKITGITVGSAIISATTNDGGYQAICNVNVQANRVTVAVDSVIVSPTSAELVLEQNIQLTAEVLPVDADDKTITWTSSAPAIASVDANGLVTAKTDGVAIIRATAASGRYATSTITAKTKIPGVVNFDDRNKYLSTTYNVGGTMDVICNFTTTTGTVVDNDGIKFWLREIRPGWSVAKDYTAIDKSVAGLSSGTARATISLDGAIPTNELTTGHFYFLWISFKQNDGSSVVNSQNMFPIQIVRTTGIKDLSHSETMIYPNPSRDKIYIKNFSDFEFLTFYNLTGSKVFTAKVNSNQLDISQLANGIYFAELRGKSTKTQQKIIIRR